jgi:ATP-grasp domain
MTEQNSFYLITSNSEAGTLETLPPTKDLNIVSVSDLENNNFQFSNKQKICITSEASLDVLMGCINDDTKIDAILKLKDKYKFRQILSEIYPNYAFKLIDTAEIKDLVITEKSVIKPVKGCFGTAVRVIEPTTDFGQLSIDLQEELQKNGTVFSDTVLSKEKFLVEEFIDGEEFAVDMFYNADREPCIVNIYHHPMPNNLAYLHMIYYSSKNVFDDIYAKAKHFFTALNKILKVKNFAMHSEFKLNGENLVPIEINSMRFGGMGLGNMVFHGLGVNPYQYFFEDREPNWKAIWEDKKDENFAFFIAYNALNKSKANHKPNIEKLKQQFTKVLLEKHFDYQKQLAFGIFCIQESHQNITNLLAIEFDDYFDEIS